MSWSPDLFIGELRPWPDTVHVVRGKTDETRRYVPEDALVHMELHECPACANVADLQDAMDENAKLRELVSDMWDGYNDPRCEECHLKDTPTCADCPICAREAAVIDRMRELGIEVA